MNRFHKRKPHEPNYGDHSDSLITNEELVSVLNKAPEEIGIPRLDSDVRVAACLHGGLTTEVKYTLLNHEETFDKLNRGLRFDSCYKSIRERAFAHVPSRG